MKNHKIMRLNEAPNLGGFKGFGGGGQAPQGQPAQPQGGNPLGGFKGFGGGQPTQQGSVAQAAANGSVKNKGPREPRVNFCKSVVVKNPKSNVDNEIFEAHITNINFNKEKEACDAINQRIPSIPGQLVIMRAEPYITKDKNGNDIVNKGHIILKINTKYIKDIIATYAAELDTALGGLGYKTGTLGNQLVNKIAECPTQQDLKAMKDTIGGNFMEMLQKLQDLKIQNKMFNWQVHNYWLNKYNWGWVLSRSNAMLILGQKPDATFVTTENGWNKDFNRTVKPGAQRMIYYKPDYKGHNYPQWVKDKAAQSIINPATNQPFLNWNDAVSQIKGNKQKYHQLDLKAQQIAGIHCTHPVWGYDVTDTIPPQDPSKDVWAQQAGLVNNLFGQLNPQGEAEAVNNPEVAKKLKIGPYAPQQQQQQDPNQQQQPQVDIGAKREFDEKLATVAIYRYGKKDASSIPLRATKIYFDKFVGKNGAYKISFDRNAQPDALESDVLNLAYKYALRRSPDEGMVHPDKQQRVAGYVSLAIAMVAGYPFNSHGLNKFYHPQVDKQEAYAAYAIAIELLPTIKENKYVSIMGKKIIFEGEEVGVEGETMSFDEFLRTAKEILGAGGNGEFVAEGKKIKHNFTDFYNRLAKV